MRVSPPTTLLLHMAAIRAEAIRIGAARERVDLVIVYARPGIEALGYEACFLELHTATFVAHDYADPAALDNLHVRRARHKLIHVLLAHALELEQPRLPPLGGLGAGVGLSDALGEENGAECFECRPPHQDSARRRR